MPLFIAALLKRHFCVQDLSSKQARNCSAHTSGFYCICMENMNMCTQMSVRQMQCTSQAQRYVSGNMHSELRFLDKYCGCANTYKLVCKYGIHQPTFSEQNVNFLRTKKLLFV